MRHDVARARWATSLIFFANGVGVASWLSRIPAMRDQAALDDRVLGFVLLAWALGSFISFRFVGRLVERFGSGHVTQVALLAYCMMMPLPTLAHSAWSMGAWLVLVGVANGFVDVAMNAQAVAIEQAAKRPILSSFHAAFSVGGLTGAVLGAAAAHFALRPFVHVGCVALVLIAMTRWRAYVADPPAASADTPPASSFSLHVLGLGMIACFSSVGEGAMGDWSALFLRDVTHASDTQAALGYAAFSVAMTLGRIVGDRLTARFGGVRLLRVAGFVSAIGLSLAVCFPGRGTAYVGFAAVGAGLSFVVPVVFSAAGRVPGVSAGAALSVVATLSYSGFLAGPPLIGILAHAIGLRFAIAVVSVLAVTLALMASLVRDRPPSGPPHTAREAAGT